MLKRLEYAARRARGAMALRAILSPMSKRTTTNDDNVCVDAYVFDTLMRDLIGHDRAASAFVVYLLLWRRTMGAGEATVQISLRDIAEGTGFSKRGVQE